MTTPQKDRKVREDKGQIRDRTPEEQAIYNEVLPRLMAGESLKKLSEEYNIKRGTISAWKSRETKRREKKQTVEALSRTAEELVSAAQVLTVEEVDSAKSAIEGEKSALYSSLEQGMSAKPLEISASKEIKKRNAAAEMKTSLLENAADALVLLGRLRGNVGQELQQLSDSISLAITRVYDSLNTNSVIKHATHEGEVTYTKVPPTPADLSNLAATLKKLQDQLASLHNLPLGALNVASIKLDNTPTTHQHMHLHSYGSDAEPVRAPKPEVIQAKATPSGEDRMTAWQQQLMNDEL